MTAASQLQDQFCIKLEFLSQEADKMLDSATEHDVAFLVVGDPFGYGLVQLTTAVHQLQASQDDN